MAASDLAHARNRHPRPGPGHRTGGRGAGARCGGLLRRAARATRRCSPRCSVGELWYRIGQEKHYLAIAFGFVEVLPDKVTVLARIAERAQDIDMARAEAAMARAEQRIGEPRTDIDFERARIAMMKSLIRLQVASRARTRA